MKKNSQLKKGIIFALTTALISGIAIFYSKLAVIKIPPLVLTTSRNLYVAILFILYFFITKKLALLKKLTKKQLGFLFLIGLIGGSIPFYLFFSGLKMIGAQNANLVHKTLFIWVTFLAVLFLKEKINFAYLLSFFLIFLANFYFSGIKFNFNQGELLVFLATLFWSIENILAKKILKEVESEVVALFRMGVGSFFLLITIFFTRQANNFLQFNPQKLLVIVIGGSLLFSYVYFWYKALKLIPASLATLILSFSTVVGSFLSGTFTHIKLLPNEIFSSSLIILANFILSINFFLPRKIVFKKNE